MVWPLKKRSLPPPTSAGFALGEGVIPQGAPQNSDVVIKGPPAQPKSSGIPGAYVVPRGYKISGSIATSRPIVVDGEIAGPKTVANEVFVRPGGVVSGAIVTSSLVVEGVVEAPVSARKGVEVRAGGVLRGSVESPSLAVAPGANIGGCLLQVGDQP